MGYLWQDLHDLKAGQVVEINATLGVNAKLMSYDSFTFYRRGSSYKYIGGRLIKTPCRITVPYDGPWILVVDLSYRGTGTVHDVRVLTELPNNTTGSESNGENDAPPIELKDVMEIDNDKEFDVFVSHASDDKEKVTRPLVTILKEKGLKVWYDEDVLKIGDSLSKEIEKGLKQSNFGLIVVSKQFMIKPWVDRELKGLVAGSIHKGKPIIPILHGVSYDELYDFSPPLADSFYRSTDKHTIESIANEVVAVIKASKQIQRV